MEHARKRVGAYGKPRYTAYWSESQQPFHTLSGLPSRPLSCTVSMSGEVEAFVGCHS